MRLTHSSQDSSLSGPSALRTRSPQACCRSSVTLVASTMAARAAKLKTSQKKKNEGYSVQNS